MEQLLQITTIPITYELKIHDAAFEMKQGTAELEISRDKGGLKIKSKPVKVNVDTFEARSSIVPTSFQSTSQAAEKGSRVAYDATAQITQEGKLMLNAQIGKDVIADIAAQKNPFPTGEFTVGAMPSTNAKISASLPELHIQYEMDKLNFDLKVANGNFEFTPGDIEMVVTQYPDVKIEYIGDPIYVPPSADPSAPPSIDTTA